MKLKQYDGQCVRIDCVDGIVYDGICSYNNKEYNEQEYGRPEECLVMVNFLFFQKRYRSHRKFGKPHGSLRKIP